MRGTKGITLVGLVVTIIILLILAGVSIGMLTGENGILTRASGAKIETAIVAVKENLRLEQMEKTINEEKVTPETLLADGRVKRTVQQSEDGNYYMYYVLKEKSFEGMQGLGKGNIASLKDVFLIDDNLNIKYIASDGKEYGDNINNKILEDETEIRFASKAFSEYVSKISGVTEENMKFKWMKNQTKLTIADSQISNLQDLVFFPNLKELYLQNLNLENLEGIVNCINLVYYNVRNSNIKNNSEINQLINLKTYIDYNPITENNIKCLENLKLEEITLYQYNDSKTDVLSKIESLKLLSLTNTKITEIGNLNNLVNLTKLSITRSKVKSLKGIEKLKKLKIAQFDDNEINDITELANNEELQTISLKNNSGIDGNRNNYTGERLEKLNKIGEVLDRGGVIDLNKEQLGLFTNYKKLNLSSQGLSNLELLEGMTELESLELNYNNITLEDEKSKEILSNMQKLNTLTMIGNPIKDIKPINNLKALKTLKLNLDNINLKDIEDIISNINLNVTNWSTLTNCDTSKITKLKSIWNTINVIPNLKQFNKLEEIQLDHCTITEKDSIKNISDVENLKKLNLISCDIKEILIDFSKLKSIESINLSSNYISSAELKKLEVLKDITNLNINLEKNAIIDASDLLVLNPNTKINLKQNVNLTQESKEALKARFGNNVTF